MTKTQTIIYKPLHRNIRLRNTNPTETRDEPYAPEREAVPALPMSPIVFMLFIFWQHVCLKTILHFYILLN